MSEPDFDFALINVDTGEYLVYNESIKKYIAPVDTRVSWEMTNFSRSTLQYSVLIKQQGHSDIRKRRFSDSKSKDVYNSFFTVYGDVEIILVIVTPKKTFPYGLEITPQVRRVLTPYELLLEADKRRAQTNAASAA